MGYSLICKSCTRPINPYDEVESKASGKKGSKLYHAMCYDELHLDFSQEGRVLDGLGNEIFKYEEEDIEEDNNEEDED